MAASMSARMTADAGTRNGTNEAASRNGRQLIIFGELWPASRLPLHSYRVLRPMPTNRRCWQSINLFEAAHLSAASSRANFPHEGKVICALDWWTVVMSPALRRTPRALEPARSVEASLLLCMAAGDGEVEGEEEEEEEEDEDG